MNRNGTKTAIGKTGCLKKPKPNNYALLALGLSRDQLSQMRGGKAVQHLRVRFSHAALGAGTRFGPFAIFD